MVEPRKVGDQRAHLSVDCLNHWSHNTAWLWREKNTFLYEGITQSFRISGTFPLINQSPWGKDVPWAGCVRVCLLYRCTELYCTEAPGCVSVPSDAWRPIHCRIPSMQGIFCHDRAPPPPPPPHSPSPHRYVRVCVWSAFLPTWMRPDSRHLHHCLLCLQSESSPLPGLQLLLGSSSRVRSVNIFRFVLLLLLVFLCILVGSCVVLRLLYPRS